MIVRFKCKYAIVTIYFLILTFQQVIMKYSTGAAHSVVSYLDEISICVFSFFIICEFAKNKVKLFKVEGVLFISFCIFATIGMLSNMIHPIQKTFVNLVDVVVCSRFIIFYFAVRILGVKLIDGKQLLLYLQVVCKVIAIFLFLLTFHEIFFTPFFGKAEYRYFMYSIKLFFPHSTYMVMACMTCMVVLMMAMGFFEESKKNNIKYIGMFLFVMSSSLRSKAIAAAACVILLYVLIIKYNLKSKYVLLICGSILCLVIGWKQIVFYYATDVEDFVRARLQRDAFNLANEYFPFGTGFGTFGSNIAAEYYSPLYVKLGYQMLQGGSVTNNSFLSDTFWPIVIAQSGWLGTIAFALVVISFVIMIFKLQRANSYCYWTLLSIITYELISTTSESALFNPSAAPLFALFGLIVNLVTMKRHTKDILNE